MRFKDLESLGEVDASRRRCATPIWRRVTRLIATYRAGLGGAGIDYQVLDTCQPLDLALLTYLAPAAGA